MPIAKYPSILSLPKSSSDITTVLEYLLIKFPHIDESIWQQRMMVGKVHWRDGSLISTQSLLRPQQQVYYYREVEKEPNIPFTEEIIFQDQHILVAYKPHFLPVIPGGVFVNECLQNRLRDRTGIDSLQALHRLDRVTAGLVIFSVNPDTRHHYHELFQARKIHKTYQAVAVINTDLNNINNMTGKEWDVKNRIVRSEPRFLMCVASDAEKHELNSHSVIRCIQHSAAKALFELQPITGKTHQLRLHMQTLGWPILNDKYYPILQPLSEDDYTAPLQLLAKELKFIDPITSQSRHFVYEGNLILD